MVAKKILGLLSATAQTLDSLGNFTYNPYPYIYASIGHVHDKETINEAVDNLVEKGLIEKSETKGLRLTPVGAGVRKSLTRARQEEWDGRWRVMFFDIPEVQRDIRDSLRSELKKLSFGLWQRSVWVTPFDISAELGAYLEKQSLSDTVQIVVGERFGGLDDRKFASRVWPLNEVNEEYKHLLGAWKEEVGKESTAEERLEAAASLHNHYLDILVSDPRLPPELLPSDWVGDDAHELFKKLKSILTGGKPF